MNYSMSHIASQAPYRYYFFIFSSLILGNIIKSVSVSGGWHSTAPTEIRSYEIGTAKAVNVARGISLET